MAPFRIYQQSKQKCSSKSMQIGNDFSYEIVRIGKKLKSVTTDAPILEVSISPADAVKLQKRPTFPAFLNSLFH